MTDDLDDFVKELQDKIDEDALRDYGRKGFDIWQNPDHMHSLENPDGYGRIAGSCGDTMEIFLKFKGGKAKEASFLTDGCGASIICGSIAVELACGKEPDDILDITGERIIRELGSLPETDRHCAVLAAETLQKALDDYMKKKL